MWYKNFISVLMGLFLVISPLIIKPAFAATPSIINTQIRLRNTAGTPITTATTLQFSIYSVSSGGLPTDAATSGGWWRS
jgi:hypothetical protein